MPSGVSAVGPHQSSTNYKSLSELLFMAGDSMSDQDVWQIGPTELMQPITDQLPCLVLEWQDVFDDYVSVYMQCCQDIVSALLRGKGSLNFIFKLNIYHLQLLYRCKNISSISQNWMPRFDAQKSYLPRLLVVECGGMDHLANIKSN